jgi:DNA-binding beta-propeller fold protein YncE
MRAVLVAALLAACGPGDRCGDGEAGIVCLIAGTGAMGFNGDGKAASDTELYLVSRVRRGPDGRVYLMDFNNHRLRVIGEDGRVATVAGNGFHNIALSGEPAVDSPLENPIGFDFLPDGRPVFVSYHDPRVLTIDEEGILHVLAGNGVMGTTGDEGDGGPALSASFMQLADLAVGPDGAIYVADDMANRVRVIRDGVVTTVLGSGDPSVLNLPTAIELDDAGNLFVADSLNHRIQKVAPDGTATIVAGLGGEGFGGDGGPATAAVLSGPNGLAVAADGTLYLSDRGNFRIRRVRPDGLIETVAGSGARGRSGDGGPPLEAEFGFIAGLALDGETLLVADQTNSCAREIRF